MQPERLPKNELPCPDYLDQCPCLLADINRCPVCSLLHGEDFCNCEWVGICIYSNYLWQKNHPVIPSLKKNQFQPVKKLAKNPDVSLLYGHLSPTFLKEIQKGELLNLQGNNPKSNLQAVLTEIFSLYNLVELTVDTPLANLAYYSLAFKA